MKRISLNGKWRLTYALEGTTEAAAARTEAKTVPAAVPGNVEIDLMKAGELPDLFFGGNIFKARPYEFYEWTYERTFVAPEAFKGRRTELVFHGVDCIASYWLNDRCIGQSDNMFIEHSFDVGGFLACGRENRLAVKIASAVNHARRYRFEPSACRWDFYEAAFLRKAAHSYGWDIMPRLVSAGIWRPVELVAHEPTEFLDLHYFTQSVGRDAAIGLLYNFVTDEPVLEGFEIQVKGVCGSSTFQWRGPVSFTAGEVTIHVPQAKAWWPHTRARCPDAAGRESGTCPAAHACLPRRCSPSSRSARPCRAAPCR